MTNPKPRDDPSTEQILESIGRIVSEGEDRAPDEAPGGPAADAPQRELGGDDDVLDLVDMVDEQGNVIPLERAVESALPARTPAPAGRSAGSVADGGRATEEQLLEALRPMLQAWLDTHLPPIVARLVQREIERAAQRSEPE